MLTRANSHKRTCTNKLTQAHMREQARTSTPAEAHFRGRVRTSSSAGAHSAVLRALVRACSCNCAVACVLVQVRSREFACGSLLLQVRSCELAGNFSGRTLRHAFGSKQKRNNQTKTELHLDPFCLLETHGAPQLLSQLNEHGRFMSNMLLLKSFRGRANPCQGKLGKGWQRKQVLNSQWWYLRARGTGRQQDPNRVPGKQDQTSVVYREHVRHKP